MRALIEAIKKAAKTAAKPAVKSKEQRLKDEEDELYGDVSDDPLTPAEYRDAGKGAGDAFEKHMDGVYVPRAVLDAHGKRNRTNRDERILAIYHRHVGGGGGYNN